jgi:arylsulfatase A-like enzyme
LENGIQRHTHLPVFPDLLKKQGYVNIMVGKTHFGPVPSSFDAIHTVTEKHIDANDAYARHIRSHGYSRVSSHPNPVPEHLFMDSFIVDTTIQEIEKAVDSGKRPFFAFCSLVSPHAPIDPPEKWASVYNDIELPEFIYVPEEAADFPEHLKMLIGLNEENRKITESFDFNNSDGLEKRFLAGNYSREFFAELKKAIDRVRKLYYGLSAYCDAQIGRLIHFLDQSGLRENTLVIFSSDHGQQYFDHGINDKHNYYDSTWRVPLIMSMPGTLPCGESRDFALWTDITASILAAAGTKCSSMQGFDLFTPLSKGEPSPRRCAAAALYKSVALATKRWKLECYLEEGQGKLFDRLKDPQERTNLYENPDYRQIRDALLTALLWWRADLTDLTHLSNATIGGGPVARRAAAHTVKMKGIDSEIRLNLRVQEIENSNPN